RRTSEPARAARGRCPPGGRHARRCSRPSERSRGGDGPRRQRRAGGAGPRSRRHARTSADLGPARPREETQALSGNTGRFGPMRTHSLLLVSALALLAIPACNTGGLQSTTQSGRLNVYLTDAPLGDVASATVTISKVYLIGGSEESGHRFTITDTTAEYDLL